MPVDSMPPVSPQPAKRPRGSDLGFAIRFFAWAAAFVGGIWALDYFFK